MLKVIIADDEEKVCQLIYKLIDWKSLDMDIAGVAHNGIEALDLVKRLHVDLIITDIRMPGYDGLELISRIKRINNDIDFIIISGYSNFEYAQRAIKYGVIDYLLKPIKKNELIAILTKISMKYRRKMEMLSEQENLENRKQVDIDKLRSGLFSEVLLQKNGNSSLLTMEAVNHDYHYHFEEGCFQVIIIKLDCGYEEGNNSSLCLLEDKIIQVLNHFFERKNFDFDFYIDDSITYCVLNYREEQRKIIRKQFKAIIDELLIQKSIFGQMEITIGVGKIGETIGQLKDSCISATLAIEERLIRGTGIIIEGIETFDVHQISSKILSEINKQMGEALEVLDKERVLSTLEYLKDEIKAEPDIGGSDVFRLCQEASHLYLNLLRFKQLDNGDTEKLVDQFEFYAKRCPSIEEILEYLSILIDKSLDKICEDRKHKDARPIRIAKQYIKENFSNPITLEDVSSFVGFSASYFSTLFKKESGVNFQEYLSEVRMNQAKEMLKQTNMNIEQICEQVGYSDLKHFVKNFRKNTGIKPNEYRKLYS